MLRLALVQNQSEMAHYAYADCRSVFKDLGYEVTLYTAQNIEVLAQSLGVLRFDALILGSNALNDKTIRNTVYGVSFQQQLSVHLNNGSGLLILLQLRVAQQNNKNETNGALSFLPEQYEIKLCARPELEKAETGVLLEVKRRQRHPSLVYPYEIDLSDVLNRSINGPTLRGLYWHYIEGINEAQWDGVVFDENPSGNRTLITVAKETESHRIAICALPLDWQRHNELLANLTLYATQGSHRTAVFGGFDVKSDPAFAYLTETLRASRFPFRHYTDDEHIQAQRSIVNGAHSLVILAQDRKLEVLPSDLKLSITDAQKKGNLGLIAVEQKNDLQQIYFSGRDYQFRQQLEALLIHYAEDLEFGYIDGSFFSTIESLQIIKRFKWSASIELLRPTSLNAILSEVETHDRDGSYDEVFHPSCAMLWLRSLVYGIDGDFTKKTAKWVRSKYIQHQPREKALGLYSLFLAGVSTKEEKVELEQLIDSQLQPQNLTELDLIFFLEIAVEIKLVKTASQIVSRLLRTQDPITGCWVDLSTTATAVYWILSARGMPEIQKSSSDLLTIYKALSYIHLSRSSDTNSRGYNWDKKAVTSLRCLAALSLFERTLELPISQVTAMISSLTSTMTAKRTTLEALDVVQRLKENHVLLKSQLQQVEKTSKSTKLELDSVRDSSKILIDASTKENSMLKRSLEKLSIRTHIEVGVFWFVIPALLIGTLGAFFAILSKYSAVVIPKQSNFNLALDAVLEWQKWNTVALLFTVLGVIGYFAKKRVSSAKKDSD